MEGSMSGSVQIIMDPDPITKYGEFACKTQDKFARRTYDITKWRIFKMADFQNGGFSKWRISKMADFQNGGPVCWQARKIDGCPAVEAEDGVGGWTRSPSSWGLHPAYDNNCNLHKKNAII
jgi:hypothetical protein